MAENACDNNMGFYILAFLTKLSYNKTIVGANYLLFVVSFEIK
jgi:hypothetical protein